MKRRERNDSESDNDTEMLPPPQKKQRNKPDQSPKGTVLELYFVIILKIL